jgi:predicted esterase
MPAQEHHIAISRTARYWTLGDLGEHTQEIWFVLHGYGQLGEYFIQNFKSLNDGSRFIIAPEGLSRFYLQPREFTGRIGATWMTREDRESEIRDYVAYLDALYASLLVNVDSTTRSRLRVCVLGFSQGVTTACRWILLGHAEVHRLLCWAGGLPADIDLKAYAEHLRLLCPIFIAGSTDEYITEKAIAEQRAMLEQIGVEYHFIQFEGGHHLDNTVLMQLAADVSARS